VGLGRATGVLRAWGGGQGHREFGDVWGPSQSGAGDGVTVRLEGVGGGMGRWYRETGAGNQGRRRDANLP